MPYEEANNLYLSNYPHRLAGDSKLTAYMGNMDNVSIML